MLDLIRDAVYHAWRQCKRGASGGQLVFKELAGFVSQDDAARQGIAVPNWDCCASLEAVLLGQVA